MMKEGWILGEDDVAVWLSNGSQELTFDFHIPIPYGALFAIDIHFDAKIGGIGKDGNVKVTMQQAHNRLRHMSEEIMRKTTKGLWWELNDKFSTPCEAYLIGEAKQKNGRQ